MRRLLLVLLATAGWLAALPAHAQSGGVRGFVTDAANGEALVGANVALWAVDTPDRLRGGAAGANGVYSVTGLAPGRYVLRATLVGYTPQFDTLSIGTTVIQRDVALVRATATLGEAVVESERVAGSANLDAGFQRIRPEDIAAIPAPDVSGDLVNYVVSMPGVVTTGDRGGQLFIRGGEPTQNQVFLDRIPVFQPYHVLGFYSAFPADLVQTADIYAGGYDARFGGQLSSVLDVSARTGNLRRLAASSSVAPFVASASAEGPLVRDQVSLLVSGRVSTVEQIAARYVPADMPFAFGDVLGKLYVVPSQSSRISVTGLHTWDRGGIGTASGAALGRPDEVRYRNTAAGLRYVFLPGVLPFIGEMRLSYAHLTTSLGTREAPPPGTPDITRRSDIGRIAGEFELTYLLGNVDLRTGGAITTTRLDARLGGAFQGIEDLVTQIAELTLFVQPEVRLGPLVVSPGVRYTLSPNLDEQFVEPRLRASVETGRHRLSLAAGLYNQPLVGISDRRDATSIFTAWTLAPDRATPRATHLIAGYRLRPVPWADVSVEGYHKRMYNLSIAEWTSFPRLTTALQRAEGEAVGADVRFEVRPGRALLMANYGWNAVTYTATSRRNQLWYGDETLRFRPAHDRRHQVTLVASVPVAGFALSGRWQFGSGLPYSRALGFDRFVLVDGIPVLTEDAGTPRVLYERPFNGLLPDYHRLDISVDRTFRLPLGRLTAQAGLLNTYDRANLFAYDLFTLERVDQLPLIPTFGLKLELD